MSNGVKTYTIKINGLQESVSQVDSLTSKLDALEQKMNSISRMGGSVSTRGGSSSQELDAQAKLMQQIEATETKIAEARSKDYQQLLEAKQELKEITEEQKEAAAAARLLENSYDSTMKGMKAELRDIKKVLNGMDTSSANFKELSERANELTSRLKDIEASYGTFSRNVGNYSNSVKSAFKGISVDIGGVKYEFNDLRDASQQLKSALGNLEYTTGSGTEEYRQMEQALRDVTQAQQRLNKTLEGAKTSSAAMDGLLDTAQSFAALSQTYGGLKAIFGFDSEEIDKSIQKLVALQSVLNGIETIRKQMDTASGIGEILAKGNAAVDRFVASLTKAKVTTEGLTTASRSGTVAVRLFSAALKTIGIGLAIGAVTTLVTMFTKLNDETKALTDNTKTYENELNRINTLYKYRMEQLNRGLRLGNMSIDDYMVNVLKTENELLKDNITLLDKRDKQSRGSGGISTIFSNLAEVRSKAGISEAIGRMNLKSDRGLFNPFDEEDTAHNIDELIDKWKEYDRVIDASNEAINYWNKNGTDKLKEMRSAFSGLIGKSKELEKFDFSKLMPSDDMPSRLESRYANINASVRQAEAGVYIMNDFIAKMRQIDLTSEDAAKKIDELWKAVNDGGVISTIYLDLDRYYEDEQTKQGIRNVIQLVETLHSRLSDTSKEFLSAKDDWDLSAMADGLAKTLSGISKAQRDEIEKWAGNEAAEKLIEKKYGKQVADAYKEYYREIADAENQIIDIRIQTMEEGLTKTLAQLEQERKTRVEAARRNAQDNIDIAKYMESTIAAINAEQDKKILDAKKAWAEEMEQTFEDLETSVFRTMNELNERLNNVKMDNIGFNLTEDLNNLVQQIEIPQYKMDTSQIRNSTLKLLGIEREDVEDINTQYNEILDKSKQFYAEQVRLQQEAVNKKKELQQANLSSEYDSAREAETREYNRQRREIEKKVQQLKKGNNLSIQEEERYNNILETLEANHISAMTVMREEYEAKSRASEQDAMAESQAIVADGLDGMLRKYEAYYNDLSNMSDAQPTMMKILGLSFVNVGKTKKKLEEAIEGYRNLNTEISQARERLKNQRDSGAISAADFEVADVQLSYLQSGIIKKIQETNEKIDELGDDLLADVNKYSQMIGAAVLTFLNALNASEIAAYDERIDNLETYIDKYKKLLDKQREVTQEYSNSINDIESELANARGDRRDAMIDKLNAEIAAQRAAVAEQERLEREKEKLERQKKKEEDARRKAQKENSLQEAIISGALAILNATATKPYVPLGIAMGAIAAGTVAAQIATIKATKFADGGVIVGNSHSRGGVKVLGGRAEVEGGEMITNKVTTSRNVELLDFINSKRRRLDLSDFIDFYSSDKVKKNINNVTKRTKYAVGGQLPSLRTDIDLSSRLINALEDYADRDVVVSVVDINNAQSRVKKVETLAGLE